MDYKETTQEGITKEWRRSYTMTAINPYNQPPTVRFSEEDLRKSPDGRVAVVNNTACEAKYDPASTFPLLNPDTGLPLSEPEISYLFGSLLAGTATHDQFYILGYSLYMATAADRDYLLAHPVVVETPPYEEIPV